MSAQVTPVRTYVVTFGALLLLTALTVGAAFVDLGAWSTFTALAIAGVKVSLVALVFMHLRGSERMLRVVAAGGLLWLALLLGLTLADYLTRAEPPPGL